MPADVAEIASDVMSHRMLLSFDAVADGADPRHIVREILTRVPQPSLASREASDTTAVRPPPPSAPPSAPPPSAPPAAPPEEQDHAPLGEPTRP